MQMRNDIKLAFKETETIRVGETAFGLTFTQQKHSNATRDVNGTDFFRPYSNSIRSGKIFIRLYPIPSIQYPIRIRMLKTYIFMMSISITILSDKN